MRHRRPKHQPSLIWVLLSISVLLTGGLILAADILPQHAATVAARNVLPLGTPGRQRGGTHTQPATDSAPDTSSASSPGPSLRPDYALTPITDGMDPVLTRIPTRQRVVFLTIDDGANKTAQEIELLKTNHIKATLFLAGAFISGNPDFFKAFVTNGSRVEDHTVSHPLNFIRLPYEQQKNEICQMADFEAKEYGRRPVLFRPPGGPYTSVTRRAAAACGMEAIIDWQAKANAGKMNYQFGNALRPGEIVLMHFRREFPADLQAFLTAEKAAGLQSVLLEDYLQTG